MTDVTGMEPVLGGQTQEISGLEPELGGALRVPVDPRLWTALLSRSIRRIRRAVAEVEEMGEARRYLNALIIVVTNDAGKRRYRARDRRSALEALGLIGDTAGLSAVFAALEDENWQIRQYAAWALGEMGDYRAVERLTRALHDESSYVSIVAADALQRINTGKARVALNAFWDARAAADADAAP
jgi:HEAT repeat protein